MIIFWWIISNCEYVHDVHVTSYILQFASEMQTLSSTGWAVSLRSAISMGEMWTETLVGHSGKGKYLTNTFCHHINGILHYVFNPHNEAAWNKPVTSSWVLNAYLGIWQFFFLNLTKITHSPASQ